MSDASVKISLTPELIINTTVAPITEISVTTLTPPVEMNVQVIGSGPRGLKGNSFTYEDFTPEQLEQLTSSLGGSSRPIELIERDNNGYISSITRGLNIYTFTRDANNTIVGVEVN